MDDAIPDHLTAAALIEEGLRTAYREPFPGADFEWFVNCSQVQSVTFYTDLLPLLHRLLSKLPYGAELSLLDAGAASAAGSDLIARLHRTPFLGQRLNVTALDLFDTYKAYADQAFPLVNYRIGDLFEMENDSFDLGLCSHVIEHFEDPTEFIRKLQAVCRLATIFYAPYREKVRIEGHLRTIDLPFVQGFDPVYAEIRSSAAWRQPNDANSECILFVLPGRDFAELRFGETREPRRVIG